MTGKFKPLDVNIDEIIDYVSFSEADRDNIKRLNFPGSEKMFDSDPQVAREAKRAFLSEYLGIDK